MQMIRTGNQVNERSPRGRRALGEGQQISGRLQMSKLKIILLTAMRFA